jgi:alpha-tubulin suppressor-like RCC1 family protein
MTSLENRMRWSLLASLSIVLACSTDATPKTKPVVAPPVEVKQPVLRDLPPDAPLPPMVAAPTFSTVAAGRAHSCGITESAALFCWGRNDQGQLGDSGMTDQPLPVPVGRDLDWRLVTTGGSHSCAVTTEGATYCWGASTAGQLGSDTLGTMPFPYRIQNTPTFVKISAGENHTCAITTDGKLYCWGENLHGELGSSVFSKFSPAAQVAPQLTWARVSAGTHSTCAITIEGKLYCWGLDSGNALNIEATDTCQMDGVPAQCSLPLRQPVDSLRFSTVATGVTHSCAITGGGLLYCWGSNDQGQLGSGFRDARGPTPVMGEQRWTAVSAGREFTCALTRGGVVQCWGADGDGQLAGRAADATVPAPVAGSTRFIALSSGTAHSCAVSTDHLVYCWGANGHGQLGTGGRKRGFAPALLMFPDTTQP